MRYEVKFLKGRFVPFGNTDVNATALDIALDYVQDPHHAERYAIAAIKRGARGGHAGSVKVTVFERDAVLTAIRKFANNGRNAAPALGVHNGGIAVLRCEYSAIRQTFGTPIEEYDTDLTRREDLRPDPGCANAPYARAWEKVCAAAVNGKWVGGLRNVQIDIVVNDADD